MQVVKVIPPERVSELDAEQIIDVPVPQSLGRDRVSQERARQRTDAQIVDVPVPHKQSSQRFYDERFVAQICGVLLPWSVTQCCLVVWCCARDGCATDVVCGFPSADLERWEQFWMSPRHG